MDQIPIKYQLLGAMRDHIAKLSIEATVSNVAHLSAFYDMLVAEQKTLEKEDADRVAMESKEQEKEQ